MNKTKEQRMEESEAKLMRIRDDARMAGRKDLEKLEEAQEKHRKQKGGDGNSE